MEEKTWGLMRVPKGYLTRRVNEAAEDGVTRLCYCVRLCSFFARGTAERDGGFIGHGRDIKLTLSPSFAWGSLC